MTNQKIEQTCLTDTEKQQLRNLRNRKRMKKGLTTTESNKLQQLRQKSAAGKFKISPAS